MWREVVEVGERVHGHPGVFGRCDGVVTSLRGAEKTHDKSNRVRLTRERNRIGSCPS